MIWTKIPFIDLPSLGRVSIRGEDGGSKGMSGGEEGRGEGRG